MNEPCGFLTIFSKCVPVCSSLPAKYSGTLFLALLRHVWRSENDNEIIVFHCSQELWHVLILLNIEEMTVAFGSMNFRWVWHPTGTKAPVTVSPRTLTTNTLSGRRWHTLGRYCGGGRFLLWALQSRTNHDLGCRATSGVCVAPENTVSWVLYPVRFSEDSCLLRDYGYAGERLGYSPRPNIMFSTLFG